MKVNNTLLFFSIYKTVLSYWEYKLKVPTHKRNLKLTNLNIKQITTGYINL